MADKKNIEVRSLTDTMRFDAPEGQPRKLSGYAAVFGQTITVHEGGIRFTEEIAPGAFRRALDANQEVFACWNHDVNMPVAATWNKTLRLHEDDHGLFFELDVPTGISYADDLYEAVRQGIVNQCSFWFSVDRDDEVWRDHGGMPHRVITNVTRLYECGPVTRGAYSHTSVSARALQRAAETPVTETAPEPEVTEPTVDTETQTALALLDIALAEVD